MLEEINSRFNSELKSLNSDNANKEKAPDYLGTLAPIASAVNNQGLTGNQ